MEIEGFKQRLVQRQIELVALSEEAEQGCETVTLDQTTVGRLSRIDAMQSQAMNQEAQRRRQFELVAIKSALKRLQEDDYGYCDECGNEISVGRLEIDLTSRFCIGCAEKKEQ